MVLTYAGLAVLGTGVLLIVLASFNPGGGAPDGSFFAAGQDANPVAAILSAAADVLHELGGMLTSVLGMFPARYRPGVLLFLVGAMLAVLGSVI